MTDYNLAGFRFRFLTCSHCKQEYCYTTDWSGIVPGEDDVILWSSNVLPYDPDEEDSPIPVSSISRCTQCKEIIWAEEGVNTYCKKMLNWEAASAALKKAKRPDILNNEELLLLSSDQTLTQEQYIKVLNHFWGTFLSKYEIEYSFNDTYQEWSPTPEFYQLDKLLPHLPIETDTEKINKAELFRNLGKFAQAIDLLKNVKPGIWKRTANYLIKISKKNIAHPVIIPPRTSFSNQFKRWVNRKRPRTFLITMRFTMENYF